MNGPRARLAWLTVLAAAGVGAAAAARLECRAVAVDLATARDLHGASYVGSAACRRCHEDHHRSWQRTFHRTMTQEATDAAVRGDFSGAILRHQGVTARMDRGPAGAFRMTFTPEGGPAGGPPRAVTVGRTVGSRRYQQYLAKVGDTWWRLPVAWSIEERRWFPMTAAFLFSDDSSPPADAARPVFAGGVFDRHVTRWNDNCVFCHNVAPDPGLDARTGAFRTTVAELGVACEACHGPGGEHARRNADPVRRYALHLGGGADPTIVNPSRLSPSRAADVCGRCHGQRLADDVAPFLGQGDPFVAGDDLGLYSAPLWRDTPLAGDGEAFAARFWADGTARLTAYEYQGLLQSRCAQAGALTCTSCHGMHDGDPRGQIRPAFAGDGGRADAMCTGCHRTLEAGHSRHDPAGAGARCVACHMPRIVYGVLDVHRSHRIEVPDPARAAAAGRPDACTACHVDETPTWAAAARAFMWGGAAAPADLGAPAPVGVAFAGDPIARVVAVDALGRSPAPTSADQRAARLGVLLEVMGGDRYPAIRYLAWRALRRLTSTGLAFDPSAPLQDRVASVTRWRALLGARARTPEPDRIARLRALARDADVEIGE